MSDELREAKELTQRAAIHESNQDWYEAIVDLTLAVQILIGLVEGHRHSYVRIGEPGNLTGPMQAREGQL